MIPRRLRRKIKSLAARVAAKELTRGQALRMVPKLIKETTR